MSSFISTTWKKRRNYLQTLGPDIAVEQAGHHAKFEFDAGFICLERKGVESCPSKDKGVRFFETPRLGETVLPIGKEKLVQSEKDWEVLHDPEGHNIVLIQSKSPESGST